MVDVIYQIECLVMEFADCGSLDSYLLKRQTPVSWFQRYKWAIQISDGMMYLHNQDLVHGISTTF